ncbi:hypothetical protein AZ66_26660 [Paenibacillus sp. E194]|nr:hypothetical protein AZ66_26660 [Paenibacillus sp. E194]
MGLVDHNCPEMEKLWFSFHLQQEGKGVRFSSATTTLSVASQSLNSAGSGSGGTNEANGAEWTVSSHRSHGVNPAQDRCSWLVGRLFAPESVS